MPSCFLNCNDPVHHPLVEVVATEVRVAIGGLDLHDALAHFQHRHVKGAAAEVIHHDRFVLLLVETIRQRRRRRLVDNAHHLKTGNRAGVLGRLALRVVEVCRHRDDGLADRLAEVILCGLLQLAQHHRRNLRRRERLVLPVHLDGHVTTLGHHAIRDELQLLTHFVVPAAHEPLDRVHGVLRVRDGLALRDLTDQPLTRL